MANARGCVGTGLSVILNPTRRPACGVVRLLVKRGEGSGMEFHDGPIDGVIWRPLRKYHDARGWLCELFRHDELPAEFHPAMAYISEPEPGVARGPHEHVDQADCFCFLGPSNFKVFMWDARRGSPTCGARQTAVVGADNPMLLVIPAGVVHA